MTHDGKLPALGCRCIPCLTARLRVWQGLTQAQRDALEALDFAVPRHPSDLRMNAGVSHATLAAMLFPGTRRPPLVRMVYLAESYAGATRMTFYTLHQHGAEIRRTARNAVTERNAA